MVQCREGMKNLKDFQDEMNQSDNTGIEAQGQDLMVSHFRRFIDSNRNRKWLEWHSHFAGDFISDTAIAHFQSPKQNVW